MSKLPSIQEEFVGDLIPILDWTESDPQLDIANQVHFVSESKSDSEGEMSGKSDFNVEKLKGSENFYDWLFTMENYLAMKGYTKCITAKSATETTVAKETDEGKLHAAKGILVLSMETILHPHIRKCTSLLDIWQKIQTIFEDRDHMR